MHTNISEQYYDRIAEALGDVPIRDLIENLRQRQANVQAIVTDFIQSMSALGIADLSENEILHAKLDWSNRIPADKREEVLYKIGTLFFLNKLNLSNNGLTSCPLQFCEMKGLRSLSLSGNSLTSLPPQIRALENLTDLSLNFNELTFLPKEIGDLTNLTTLSVGYNCLTSIPEEVAKLKKLQKLFLRKNQLTALPSSICKLTLTKLNLEENNILERNELVEAFGDKVSFSEN